jgi:putative ABC transport system permease protein
MSSFARSLREIGRNPGFSVVVVLTLALGLGATTTVFSELYIAVLKPLPYPAPDQLVAVQNLHLGRPQTSAFDYFDLRAQRDLFANVGVYFFLDLSRTGIEHAEKVNAVAMTSSMFDALGTTPLMGRTFKPEEERFHGPHALIVSERYWRDALGGDPKVLNRSLELDGQRYPIVGVMPRSFQLPNEVTQMWAPVVFRPEELASRDTAAYYLHMIARLARGVTFDQASARLDTISRQMALEHDGFPRSQPGWKLLLVPLARDDDGSVRRWMAMLLASVIGLLFVVCSNVAGLLLVRYAERQFDFSLRMALGAGRLQIARQALTEVLLLSLCGGAAGLLIARAALLALNSYRLAGKTVEMEWPVFWFGAALTHVTGLACGLYPAWSATRAATAEVLKEGGPQRTATSGKRRWQQILILVQVAIATTLLLSGGLFLRSFVNLLEAPLGFNPRNVLTMQIDLPRNRYPTAESRLRFFEQMTDQTRRIPGVESVSGCSLLPFGYGENVTPFEIVGRPKSPFSSYADVNNVSPDYLKTMQIPLLRGRFFTREELAHPEPVAVIDEALARRFFAGRDPIGESLQTPRVTARIIGVVGAVKLAAIDIEPPPTIYFPSPGDTFVVRSSLPAGALANDVEGIVARIDHDLPVYDIKPMQEWVDHSLKTRRFVVLLVTLFGVLGALLSALGIYGLLSYWIGIRRREIGIRMALGATARMIGALVYSSGLRLVAAGALLGCAGALAAHRAIASRLYGVRFADPVTWIAVAAGILAAGILACALPAWRAARTNPVDALK